MIGGAGKSPGAAMLSGLAALRVGAGRITLAVGASVAPHVGVAIPESGVVGLDETPTGHISGFSLPAAGRDLEKADAVLLGPGLDSVAETMVLVRELPRHIAGEATVVLDAFGLGVVPNVPTAIEQLAGRLVLTPNKVEAAVLLERELADLESDVVELARRYRAVVSCYGIVADQDGTVWSVGAGSGGLATSGSGDVLAGAVTACARGAPAPPRRRCGRAICTPRRGTASPPRSGRSATSPANCSANCRGCSSGWASDNPVAELR